MSCYPEPTPAAAIEQAVSFAEALRSSISALTFRIEIPSTSNVLANALFDIPAMVASEQQRSAANAQNLISLFEATAARRGVPHQQTVESCSTSQLAALVTEHARMHDITMIPVGEEVGLQQYFAETVIFGSGRPTIVLPGAPKRSDPLSLNVIGVAWDFGRPAARAVADALPILERAKTVRVVTITQEKTIETKSSGADLAKHLACHGIETVLE